VTALPADDDGEPPVLDERVLRELQEIMQDDYLELLETYLDNAPALLADAGKAVAAHDAKALVLPVHSLKSSSANVGAMAVSALAKEAEQLAREGDADGVAEVYARIEEAFDVARGALRSHVDARRSG
jgi:HPt (histidine-containing phosphotransfer) domain-containing protein